MLELSLQSGGTHYERPVCFGETSLVLTSGLRVAQPKHVCRRDVHYNALNIFADSD
jgi:hypothetical protein